MSIDSPRSPSIAHRTCLVALMLAPAASMASCSTEGHVLGPVCVPTASSETACSDGADDDCDGFPDCLDTECDALPCGAGAGLTCTAGACLMPCVAGDGCLPTLKAIQNVRPVVFDDTLRVEFEPVAGALDYRIYPYPSTDDVLVGAAGEVVVRNAIYRCAGERPIRSRENDPAGYFDASLAFNDDVGQGYARTEPESVLGYVYLTPSANRAPVYRMADPNGSGGFWNSDWLAPSIADANAADYVVGTTERDRLLGEGFRDDGIAFYVPLDGDRPVYRALYEPDNWGDRVSFFYTDGAERDVRSVDPNVIEQGERFRVRSVPDVETVELHRVFYLADNAHDVLAAGDARYQRTLHQGNVPVNSLTWSGITEETTFVIEALDAGCPFPNGYIGAVAAPADEFNHPTLTLDEARLLSGEVFVNGQHDPANRPRPVARSFVTVSPGARPTMAWQQTFDPGTALEPFDVQTENNGVFVMRNTTMAVDFSGCSPNLSIGPMLGQLVVGFADYGSSCNMSIYPHDVATQIGSGNYVHMRMSSDIPSTGRRYPQLMITTTAALDPGPGMTLWDTILHHRLGPLPFDLNGPDMMAGTADDGAPGDEVSLIVQPFGGYHELQVQICDHRGWGVGNQCSQANIYGHHAGNYTETWEEPWNPVPVLGEMAGHDRPVRFDVYASTQRVYVYVDGAPAGCAVLPAGRMPAGPVTPAFRAVLYHSGIDETVVPDDTSHRYLHDYSLSHTRRTLDDLGVEQGVALPPWDETTLPCGTRWYGG
jgi:hypothetical protein